MSDDKKSVRLLRLIQLLCKSAPRRWRAVELADELGTIVRNVYRDLNDVGEFIGLVEERPYFWVESNQAVLSRLSLTESELRSLALSTNSLQDPELRLALRGVLEKIEPNIDRAILDQVDALKAHLPPAHLARPATDRYEFLSRAVTQGLRLEMIYHSLSRSEPAPRKVDPYTLFHTRGNWYFSGYDHLSNSTRTFRISRIFTLADTGERFKPAPERGAIDYLASADEPVSVVLEVCPLTARLLQESPIHPSQDLDGARVRLVVGQPSLLIPCLLSLPEAEVLEPPSLRQALAAKAEAIAARNRSR